MKKNELKFIILETLDEMGTGANERDYDWKAKHGGEDYDPRAEMQSGFESAVKQLDAAMASGSPQMLKKFIMDWQDDISERIEPLVDQARAQLAKTSAKPQEKPMGIMGRIKKGLSKLSIGEGVITKSQLREIINEEIEKLHIEQLLK